MVKFSLKDDFDIEYEGNIPSGGDIELPDELINLIVDLFGEDFLERCSDLPQGIDRPAG